VYQNFGNLRVTWITLKAEHRLTHDSTQNLRRSERSGRHERRRKRTNVKPKKNVPELLPFLLTARMPATTPQVLDINNLADLFSSHLSATSLALKFLANIKLLPAVFSNYKSIAIAIFNILAIRHRPMAHQTRCIANVITPLISSPLWNFTNTLCR
jgi:hypothetical protein